jgi:AraC family transcriptional regulator, regulatory protein of adaptative response / methylated-DNA-[protein]-cysteine methyltransferase
MSTIVTDPQSVATLNDPRWAAVVARSRDADGTFYYSVRTTGVYCRPSCGARLARPENVSFHDTREDAEAAGFRPCKRCRPDQHSLTQRQRRKIVEACRIIEQALESAEPVPQLGALAAQVGVSRYHFHRLFREHTGLTPREYAAARREQRLREELDSSGTVTEAIFDAGYNSNGRFYAKSREVLGMTPTAWRKGGKDERIRFAVGACSLGAILVATSERGVCAIYLGDDPDALARQLQDRFPQAELVGGDAGFENLVARVVGMVEAPGAAAELPLDVRGTAFQQRVWRALGDIPAGSTASYSDIAKRIGRPGSVRAVAHACAANALAVVIPCHRVVRKDGELSGYRWGVERKRALLRKEAQE